MEPSWTGLIGPVLALAPVEIWAVHGRPPATFCIRFDCAILFVDVANDLSRAFELLKVLVQVDRDVGRWPEARALGVYLLLPIRKSWLECVGRATVLELMDILVLLWWLFWMYERRLGIALILILAIRKLLVGKARQALDHDIIGQRHPMPGNAISSSF